MASDPDYARKWSQCRSFAATGTCPHSSCRYSHTLIDTARIVALVGDLTGTSCTPTSGSYTTLAQAEQAFFLVEYTKYSLQSDTPLTWRVGEGTGAGTSPWRMRLIGGGRATLTSEDASMSVQPSYPVKGQSQEAMLALIALENKVFGCNATVSGFFGPSRFSF